MFTDRLRALAAVAIFAAAFSLPARAQILPGLPTTPTVPAATVPAPTPVAPPAALPSAAVPQIPTLTANTVPTTIPVSGPAPGMNVQFTPAVVTANDGATAPLFGTSLFTGAFSGSTIMTRPDYMVQAGDIIDVKSFGNMSMDVVARVGADGKLFLPVIGPVTVAGVTRAGLNGVLQGALGAIYTNTQVYADIVQPGAIGVFVTGQVPRPGRYLGSPTDNILYYLDKAGGIDGYRGSFRDVLVRHADGRQEHFDLYDFLIRGTVAQTKFGDGDVIVIRPRGPQVVVTGLASSAYAFELTPPAGTPLNNDIQAGLAAGIANGGQQIIALAMPNERLVTGVTVSSVRDKKIVASYKPYGDLKITALGDGDHVDFRSDTLSPTITVTLSAKLGVPSVYVTPRDATLREVLANIPVDGSDADTQSVYVVRKSVAAQQKQLLNTALLQLQEDAYTPNGIDAEQAQAQATAAGMVQQFVNAASQVQPTGQIAIYRNGKFQDIHLQDGDQIVIPEKTDVVLVAGEVLAPGAFAHRDGARIKDYIDDAGGYTVAANKDKFVLRRPNGSAQLVDDDAVPQPGDNIMVVPRVGGMTFQLVKDISTLIYQVAISAATVIAVK